MDFSTYNSSVPGGLEPGQPAYIEACAGSLPHKLDCSLLALQSHLKRWYQCIHSLMQHPLPQTSHGFLQWLKSHKGFWPQRIVGLKLWQKLWLICRSEMEQVWEPLPQAFQRHVSNYWLVPGEDFFFLHSLILPCLDTIHELRWYLNSFLYDIRHIHKSPTVKVVCGFNYTITLTD